MARRVEIWTTSEMTPYFTMTKCNQYYCIYTSKREIWQDISRLIYPILRTLHRVLDNNCKISRNISCYTYGKISGIGYVILITRVSVGYGEVFHEPKAGELSRNISRKTSVISDLSYTQRELRTRSALDNNCEVSRNISHYA